MTYVDGFVAAVPTANKAAFLSYAQRAAKLFKEAGALCVVECWGEDVPEGKLNSLHSAVMRKPDETVIFSWITWPSRQVRDAGWETIMADPRMKAEDDPMPFDASRMIFGGFEAILEA